MTDGAAATGGGWLTTTQGGAPCDIKDSIATISARIGVTRATHFDQ